jgi:hypothetical protein
VEGHENESSEVKEADSGDAVPKKGKGSLDGRLGKQGTAETSTADQPKKQSAA